MRKKCGRKRLTLAPGAVYGDYTVVRDCGVKSGCLRSQSMVRHKCGDERIASNSLIVRRKLGCMRCRVRKQKVNVRRSKAIALREAGMSTGQIAKKLKLSRERVCQFLRPVGLSARRTIQITQEIKDCIHDLVMSGATVREVCNKTGLSVAAVLRLSPRLPASARAAIRRDRDMAGRKFGRLTYLRSAQTRGKAFFICECGRRCESNLHNVRCGLTKSCGCIRAEYAKTLRDGVIWDKSSNGPLIRNGLVVCGHTPTYSAR